MDAVSTEARLGGDSPAARPMRTLWLASLGGALEFYDFVVFVFFVPVIGQLFFPPSIPDWLRDLETFGIFAAGYLARPLGGIVMAHAGDLRGRKNVFMLSIVLMAVSTLGIGLLPTYGAIGVAAPVLLLLLRMLQGAAMGGEAPGGWVFVAEHVERQRAGLAVGLLTAGLTFGILLGSLTATVCNFALTPAEMAGGFWRAPFLLGGVLGFAAMLLRRQLHETPVFESLRQRGATSQELPLLVVLRRHRLAVLLSFLSTWTLTAAIVVVVLMTPALLQKSLGVPARVTLLANLAGTAALCVSCVSVGALADRIGLRRTAVLVTAVLIAGAYALYLSAARRPDLLPAAYLLAGAGAGIATVTPLIMVRAFPAAVRFSGLSFSYNVAYAVFGGITPLLVSWLAHVDWLTPAHYVACLAVLGLVVTWVASVQRASS